MKKLFIVWMAIFGSQVFAGEVVSCCRGPKENVWCQQDSNHPLCTLETCQSAGGYFVTRETGEVDQIENRCRLKGQGDKHALGLTATFCRGNTLNLVTRTPRTDAGIYLEHEAVKQTWDCAETCKVADPFSIGTCVQTGCGGATCECEQPEWVLFEDIHKQPTLAPPTVEVIRVLPPPTVEVTVEKK